MIWRKREIWLRCRSCPSSDGRNHDTPHATDHPDREKNLCFDLLLQTVFSRLGNQVVPLLIDLIVSIEEMLAFLALPLFHVPETLLQRNFVFQRGCKACFPFHSPYVAGDLLQFMFQILFQVIGPNYPACRSLVQSRINCGLRLR